MCLLIVCRKMKTPGLYERETMKFMIGLKGKLCQGFYGFLEVVVKLN